MNTFLELIKSLVMTPVSYLWREEHRIYWLYLLLFGVIAYGLYRYRDSRLETAVDNKASADSGTVQSHSVKGFLAYLFPKAIYTHPSARADFAFFGLNSILTALVWVPLAAGIGVQVSLALSGLMAPLPLRGVLGDDAFLGGLLLTVVGLVLMDCGSFISHYLQHRLPLLWEFHKVHHSAEVLTPMTVYRMHPVDDLFAMACSASGLVVGQALVQHLHQSAFSEWTLFSLNLGTGLFYLLGYNFRHSHIWVDYGRFWDQILMSPAQHQIHHSMAPQHIDRNMGFIFSIWDKMMGTLYVPETRETLVFGIDGTEEKAFHSLPAMYLKPVANVLGMLAQGKSWPSVAVLVLALYTMVSLAVPTKSSTMITQSIPPAPIKTLMLEELTWQEVREAIGHGKTTALVPTGGVEQNGPHLVLGKHNYVVKLTAQRIAAKLGDALVAPVITYVPEGDADTKTGHMRFTGTMTVPETVFEELLTASAKSLKAHGFKVICFVGDSGGNQDAQQKVAAKLSYAWRDEGVQVLHVGRYYGENNQKGWLMSLGKSELDIGSHAGIRDTAELMLAYPGGVRSNALKHYYPKDYEQLGSDGDAASASPALGEKLIEMKVDAAVQEIRSAVPKSTVRG